MKRRTLIVDLDCPFGINHFDLLLCDRCVNMDTLVDKIPAITSSPPFAPIQVTQWSQRIDTGSSINDLTAFTNVDGFPTTGTFKIQLDTVTDTKTFDITNVSSS